MDNYQDWKPVVFNNVSKEAKHKQRIANAQKASLKPKKFDTVLKPPSDLGKQIAAARCIN